MENTIYEIANTYVEKQTEIIDPFFKETPLFNSMPVQEVSGLYNNVFEIVKDVAVPEVVNLDAPLPKIYANTELGYASIAKVGGRIEIPKDKADALGGKDKVIAKQMPTILNRAGQAFDASFMYNSLKKTALESGSYTKCGGEAASSQYSMIGITWSQGENCGLFQPKLSGAKMFDTYALFGGNLGNISDKAGKDISGWVIEMVLFMGIQLARPNDRLHALVNIDADHIPTADILLDFVDAFDGYTNSSVIYAHPKCINFLKATYMKDLQSYRFITMDNNGNVRINGCLVVPDKNMLKGTEEVVA